jgi:dipeptidyl aminopeptidase/acylaminoacyl peptidase
MMSKVAALLLAMAGGLVSASATAGVDLDAMLKHSQFDVVEISPDGQYLAATVPKDDREGLIVMRRSDSSITTAFTLGKDEYIHRFEWVNSKRLLIRVAEKIGALEQPQETGQLYGLDFDQKTPDVLVGWETPGQQLGTLIGSSKERVAALTVDKIPGDEHHVIITAYPYSASERFNTAELLDVDTGRRTVLAHSPIKSARFYPDNAGVVRFAAASQKDNARKLWYRPTNDADWKLINDEAVSGFAETPLGFSADNRTAYLTAQRASGPDAIVAYDTDSGERKELLRDAFADPEQVVTTFDGRNVPVGVIYDDGIPHSAFFDPQSREARLYAMLGQAFPGSAVKVTSTTSDGKLMLVLVYSDRDPGKFYLFDTQSRQAQYLLSQKRWIDPKAMAQMRILQIKAHDGVPLRAYLTLPPGRDARNLPLVVFPHGGPFTIYDRWHFDTDAQLLAAAGYAVLQVNYRGSGNYGKHFLEMGQQQWGRAMQDDLTDAAEWTVAQGIVDRSRMCLYGASYGAYASLEGVTKDPAMYKCAVGYVGVYDLPMLVADASDKSTRLENWTREWIGNDPAQLAKASPNLTADRIKVPVFLAAGGEDKTAPIEHTEKMEAALKKAGASVETLYVATEGHGFYTLEHRREFYTRLLAFLDRNIGEKTRTAAAH